MRQENSSITNQMNEIRELWWTSSTEDKITRIVRNSSTFGRAQPQPYSVHWKKFKIK